MVPCYFKLIVLLVLSEVILHAWVLPMYLVMHTLLCLLSVLKSSVKKFEFFFFFK